MMTPFGLVPAQRSSSRDVPLLPGPLMPLQFRSAVASWPSAATRRPGYTLASLSSQSVPRQSRPRKPSVRRPVPAKASSSSSFSGRCSSNTRLMSHLRERPHPEMAASPREICPTASYRPPCSSTGSCWRGGCGSAPDSTSTIAPIDPAARRSSMRSIATLAIRTRWARVSGDADSRRRPAAPIMLGWGSSGGSVGHVLNRVHVPSQNFIRVHTSSGERVPRRPSRR
mmetsp:Transcript_7893/g.24761  ORF Transcript_7893/g.24761 Transcript_7893/m.24761 type:complete len:227 (-) Transcript_7893:251-931(-)